MTLRNITKQVIAFLLVLLVCIGVVMGGQGNLSASAASEMQTAFEESNVLDDLTGGTVGGKKFSLADYPHNSDGKPQIISFTEFCYSYYAEKQGDYGLYVYVYNPQDIAFDMQTSRNQIQLTYGSKTSYSKYPLIFCNYSTQVGYEGRFFKFRVQLAESEKEDILQTVKPDARVYKVSGIELSYKGQVTDYPCAQSYTYTGFAEGYGSELATSDTLSCRVNGFEKYLTLNVHSTYYRPEGTNGKNDYTQDSLHSVYFAIPRSVVSEYGKMTAVHATWLDATLAPVLVTGSKEAYDAISPYLGQSIGTNTEGLEHAYAGSANYTVTSWAGVTALYGWDCAYTFNLPRDWSTIGGAVSNKTAREVSPLYWLAYAGEGTDSADGYVLSSEEIEERLKEYTQKYGGTLVNDRYSRVLFDTVADSFTEVNTLLVHILKSITAWLWRRDLRMHNKYGYCILKIEKERGTMDGKVENKKYFLMNQKIYARRFATDCFSDYFNDMASKSGMGLADYREYVTERASVDELKAQNSLYPCAVRRMNGQSRMFFGSVIPMQKIRRGYAISEV